MRGFSLQKEPVWQSLFARLFARKEVIIRSNGRVVHRSYGYVSQLIVFALCVATVSWGLFVTGVYFLYDDILAAKNDRIHEARTAYQAFLSDVSAYKEELTILTDKMDQNYAKVAQLNKQLLAADSMDDPEPLKLTEADKTPEVLEKAGEYLAASLLNPSSKTVERERLQMAYTRMQNEHKALKAESRLLSDKLFALTEGESWASVDTDSADYEVRKILLQRDIAMQEKTELHTELQTLRDQIARMQDAQVHLFDEMANLAENGTQSIEDVLKAVERPLKKRKMTIDKLMKREETAAGKGGPFMPAIPLPDLGEEALNTRLASLNEKLERWQGVSRLKELMPLGRPFTHRIRVTSPFGYRKDPFNGRRAYHEGLDMAGAVGAPLYATAPGKVVRAGRNGFYGKMVEVKHPLGFSTRYAHMHKILVNVGDELDTGDKIGLVGNTGRSSASHLHYEVRIDKAPVNPYHFVKAKKDVLKKETD